MEALSRLTVLLSPVALALLVPVLGGVLHSPSAGVMAQTAARPAAIPLRQLEQARLLPAIGNGKEMAANPSATMQVSVELSQGLIKYLDLKADQTTKIQQNNQVVVDLVTKGMERQAELSSSLQRELAKDQLDSALIGQIYVEFESLRRQMSAAEQKARTANQEVLTAAQKSLLKVFEEAIRNSQLIDEAGCQALLPAVAELTNGVGGSTGGSMNATDQLPLCGLRYGRFGASDGFFDLTNGRLR